MVCHVLGKTPFGHKSYQKARLLRPLKESRHYCFACFEGGNYTRLGYVQYVPVIQADTPACTNRLWYMHVPTYLVALNIHGPRFTTTCFEPGLFYNNFSFVTSYITGNNNFLVSVFSMKQFSHIPVRKTCQKR